jgi:hypothetical protein
MLDIIHNLDIVCHPMIKIQLKTQRLCGKIDPLSRRTTKTPKFHFNLYIKHQTIYTAQRVNDSNCDMSYSNPV